jgi:hypothetical protein
MEGVGGVIRGIGRWVRGVWVSGGGFFVFCALGGFSESICLCGIFIVVSGLGLTFRVLGI